MICNHKQTRKFQVNEVYIIVYKVRAHKSVLHCKKYPYIHGYFLTEPVPLKYGKLATKSVDIRIGLFYSVAYLLLTEFVEQVLASRR